MDKLRIVEEQINMCRRNQTHGERRPPNDDDDDDDDDDNYAMHWRHALLVEDSTLRVASNINITRCPYAIH